jgi:hypothetical protein
MDIATVMVIAGILIALALSLWRIWLRVSADGVITLEEVFDAVEDASEAILEAKDDVAEAKDKESDSTK